MSQEKFQTLKYLDFYPKPDEKSQQKPSITLKIYLCTVAAIKIVAWVRNLNSLIFHQQIRLFIVWLMLVIYIQSALFKSPRKRKLLQLCFVSSGIQEASHFLS